MPKVAVTDYSFNPTARTVTLSGLSTVEKNRIFSIHNVTTNATIYTEDQAATASLSGKVLTLAPASQITRATPKDKLHILYRVDATPSAEPVTNVAGVDGLQTALDGKANTSHAHTIANVTGLQAALSTKVSQTGITWIDGPVDFNTLVTPGIYIVAGVFLNGAATTYNQPGNSGALKLVVTTCVTPVDVVIQEYISIDGANKGGQRRRWAGTWNGWMAY